MQLDVDIEPILRLPGVISNKPNLHFFHRQTEANNTPGVKTDRQKVTLKNGKRSYLSQKGTG